MQDFHFLQIGPRLTLSFQRTLRVPNDGRAYPLPPGLGAFPVYRARHFPRAPEAWARSDDLFIAMYDREALWIGLNGAPWHPDAIMVGLGNVNAVSGKEWWPSLSDSPANYLVCPPQPWIDGVNAGGGNVRQFVALSVDSKHTVEGQVKPGEEQAGGLRVAAFAAKSGRFPDEPPPADPSRIEVQRSVMGLGAGGVMRQKIYPDPHGLDTWEPAPVATLRIHILNAAYFESVTGLPAPPTPINAKTYTDAGFPWFDLYDTGLESLPLPEAFARLHSSASDDTPLEVPETQIWKLQ